jgi:hemerythrin-like domain-containing protein
VDALDLLTAQHRDVEDDVDRFRATDDPQERATIAKAVIRSLRLHTTIEEQYLYPGIRERIGDLEDDVLEDLEEHHAMEMLLDELEHLDPTDERFAPKFLVMSELVAHHVEEEEQDEFPVVREHFPAADLEQLGEQMQARYTELLQEQIRDELTKEQLYRLAQEHDLPGRGQMSKRQLAAALADAGIDLTAAAAG